MTTTNAAHRTARKAASLLVIALCLLAVPSTAGRMLVRCRGFWTPGSGFDSRTVHHLILTTKGTNR